MYAKAQAFSAYQGKTHIESLSPRDLEKRVFLQVTGRLERALEDSDPLQVTLNQALSDNILLWNALAADVADEGNQLPQQLKAQIFYLSRFMTQQTALVRKERNKEKIKEMININRMMVEGLSAQPASSQEDSSDNNFGAGA